MSDIPPSKLCACGCGLPAPLASKTNRAQGYVKGQPMRFVVGHNARLPEYRAQLRPPAWTDERRERHAATKRARALGRRYKAKSGNTWYWRVLTTEGYRYEHRLVAGEARGQPLDRSEHVHHLNGDGLDNRPENLRVVSHSEHMGLHRGEPRTKSHSEVARLPQGVWSRRFACCNVCGTTDRKHSARGLCSACYRRQYGNYR